MAKFTLLSMALRFLINMTEPPSFHLITLHAEETVSNTLIIALEVCFPMGTDCIRFSRTNEPEHITCIVFLVYLFLQFPRRPWVSPTYLFFEAGFIRWPAQHRVINFSLTMVLPLMK